MLKIDENLLKDLGLASLPADDKNQMLAQIYETLEMRVGMTLARQMTDAQLKEFEVFVNSNDEAGALKWLETNFPTYKDVVHTELGKLKEEIKKSATQILTEMQAAREEKAQMAAATPQNPADPSNPAQDPISPGLATPPVQTSQPANPVDLNQHPQQQPPENRQPPAPADSAQPPVQPPA